MAIATARRADVELLADVLPAVEGAILAALNDAGGSSGDTDDAEEGT